MVLRLVVIRTESWRRQWANIAVTKVNASR